MQVKQSLCGYTQVLNIKERVALRNKTYHCPFNKGNALEKYSVGQLVFSFHYNTNWPTPHFQVISSVIDYKVIMKNEIIAKIRALGGEIGKVEGDSLRANLEAVSFSNSLYDRDWGLYGISEYLDRERTLYERDESAFLEGIVDHFHAAKEDKGYGQIFWRGYHFAPMTEGSDDYEEWQELLSDTEYTYFSEIRELVGDGPLEFVQIMHSYGYPDHYYVCLSDPVPENPTVFGTDHEELFQDIRNYGSLESFLGTILERHEFIGVIKEELKNISSK